MIMKFSIFESRFSDLATITRIGNTTEDDEFYKTARSNVDNSFIKDESLIEKVYCHNPRKVVRIKWNSSTTHNIVQKIKERTTHRSVSEFNDIFQQVIESIIPSEIGNQIDRSGTYALYLNEHHYYILIEIDYNRIFDTSPMIFVVTIHISSPANCYKIITIDENNLKN